MQGYVKIKREFIQTSLWLAERFSRGQAFLDLIMLANHGDSFVYKRGIKIRLKRGQIGWSIRSLATRWKWSIEKTRRFLRDLESESLISTQKTNASTTITVLNYDEMQDTNKDTERTQNGHRTDTEPTQSINDKNDDEGKIKNNNRQKKEFGGDRAENIREDFFDTYLDSLSRQFPGYNIVDEFDDNFCSANRNRRFDDVEDIFRAFYSYLKK